MNITLIGMPGVGKSFIGKQLAKRLGYSFVDADEVIEKKTGFKLQQIIDDFGDKEFLKIEEKIILELGGITNSVIAPGGSVIYLPNAMSFLKRNSTIVFLDAPLTYVQRRLADREERGIVGLKEKGLKALYEERLILYRKYADFIVDVSENDRRDRAESIIRFIIQKTHAPYVRSSTYR